MGGAHEIRILEIYMNTFVGVERDQTVKELVLNIYQILSANKCKPVSKFIAMHIRYCIHNPYTEVLIHANFTLACLDLVLVN